MIQDTLEMGHVSNGLLALIALLTLSFTQPFVRSVTQSLQSLFDNGMILSDLQYVLHYRQFKDVLNYCANSTMS